MTMISCAKCGHTPPRGEEPVTEPDGTVRVYPAVIDGKHYCHGDEGPDCWGVEMQARSVKIDADNAVKADRERRQKLQEIAERRARAEQDARDRQEAETARFRRMQAEAQETAQSRFEEAVAQAVAKVLKAKD